MRAKFNPTGTHIQNGILKVRVDLYPEPHNKTYAMHYVDKPVRPLTEAEWGNDALRALVPTYKELNPCLCHFINVNADITTLQLAYLVQHIFDSDTQQRLDDVLVSDNREYRLGEVGRIMAAKCGAGTKVSLTSVQEKELITRLNKRLASVEVSVGD